MSKGFARFTASDGNPVFVRRDAIVGFQAGVTVGGEARTVVYVSGLAPLVVTEGLECVLRECSPGAIQ